MDDKNELSDIVLDKDESKILKTKRVLIIVAILVILFLAVILSMKLFNGSNNNRATNIVLPPEPTTAIQETKKDEELFKQVPIIEENGTKKDNFENIVKNLKAKETKIADKEKKIATKEKIDKVIQPVVKPILKQKNKKSTKKREIDKKESAQIAKKGIYIQVGATSKLSPNKKFLKKITDQKLHYRLLPITVKGKKVMKILIGPFKSRTDAKQNLPKVRKYFNKNAFIYSIR